MRKGSAWSALTSRQSSRPNSKLRLATTQLRGNSSMAYGHTLPPDTQNEIQGFIEDNYIGLASMMAAATAVDIEIAKVTANPTLGASVPGGPFESRRIHRFVIAVGDHRRTVELAYKINHKESRIVFSGFQEIKHNAL